MRTGVASIKWVRPILTTSSQAVALSIKAPCRRRRAGKSVSVTSTTTATWIAVGMVSLDDCDILTWSFG